MQYRFRDILITMLKKRRSIGLFTPFGRQVGLLAALLPVVVSCGGYVPSWIPADNLDPADAASYPLPPLASAGADREILRGYSTFLNAAGSYHPGGRNFSVSWRQLEGDAVHLSNAASLRPTFVAPLDEQVLVFEVRAFDGETSTVDTVTLWVKESPNRAAPRVRAAADRVLNAGDSVRPLESDAIHQGDGEVVWEQIFGEAGNGQGLYAPEEDSAGEDDITLGTGNPKIYRLTKVRDGLASTPDYLLLFTQESGLVGLQAPHAELEGPTLASPGQSYELSARQSSDVNGDTISLRWEQVAGTPVVDGVHYGRTLTIQTPARAEELVFRVMAYDGLLESEPATLVMVVSAQDETVEPFVAPQSNLRAHAGNTVVLDADGLPIPSDGSMSFSWSQTYGQSVALDTEGSGRFASFVAPEAPADLAFAVSAQLTVTGETQDDSTTLESEPQVARVSVVDDSDNGAPRLSLCATASGGLPGQEVLVSAHYDDPEWDAVEAGEWVVQDSYLNTVITEPSDASIDGSVCATSSGTPEESPGQYQQAIWVVLPEQTGIVTAQIRICDHLGACATQSIQLSVGQ